MQKVVSKSAIASDRLTILVFVWTAGLSFGLYFGISDYGILSNCLFDAAAASTSIGVLFSAIPVLLCCLAAHFSLHFLTFPLCFIKAFLDGMVLMAAYGAFGSALWVIYWPLFFTDRCLNVVFLWLSAYILQSRGNRCHLPYFLAIISVTVCLDCLLISPWLHRLMI